MKTIILIGASSSVAKEVAKQLKTEGQTIISISRSQPEAPFDIYHQHDVSSDDPMPIVDSCIDGLVYFPGTINLKPLSRIPAHAAADGLHTGWCIAQTTLVSSH